MNSENNGASRRGVFRRIGQATIGALAMSTAATSLLRAAPVGDDRKGDFRLGDDRTGDAGPWLARMRRDNRLLGPFSTALGKGFGSGDVDGALAAYRKVNRDFPGFKICLPCIGRILIWIGELLVSLG